MKHILLLDKDDIQVRRNGFNVEIHTTDGTIINLTRLAFDELLGDFIKVHSDYICDALRGHVTLSKMEMELLDKMKSTRP